MKGEERCRPGEFPIYSAELQASFDELMDDAARRRAQKVEVFFERFGEVMDEL